MTLMIYLAYVVFAPYIGPQFYSCADLDRHVESITFTQCISYVNKHPESTGQEIVDYFANTYPPKKSLEELLTSTMIP